MKVNHLDAHDRLKHFTKQDFSIAECCQDLINQRPFGENPFYVFAHARTDDDGVTQRMIWQPRLTKPRAQSNSMLFKAYPGSDVIKVIWMIPKPELWDNFEEGKLTFNPTIAQSIYDFKFHRDKLEAKEEDDLCEAHIDYLYRELSHNAQNKKMMQRQFNIEDEYQPKIINPNFWEDSSVSLIQPDKANQSEDVQS